MRLEESPERLTAHHEAKAGFIKPAPKSWKDYFFPLLHNGNGS